MQKIDNAGDGTCIVGTGVRIPMNETDGVHKRTLSGLKANAKRSKAEIRGKSLLEEARSLFPGARDFTKEEAARYEKSLDNFYKSTGESFFSL